MTYLVAADLPTTPAGERLRSLLARPGTLRMPGAHNGQAGLQAKAAGFEALYLSGAAMTASMGIPDLGMITVDEVCFFIRQIARATALPLLVDGDTGYGEALNVMHMVRSFEDAGAAAVHIEDQLLPKKCGHLNDKKLADPHDMAAKIAAAAKARRHLFIIARTDAAASEGLDVLVIEANSPGGQAASSSKIENYLGFPTGISGRELASRAYAQAEKFGAEVMIAKGAAELVCENTVYGVRLDDNVTIPARTVVIATGARYHRPPLANLCQFEGAGVYYNATFMEAQLCEGDEVIVVGGANSAGQAAVFLAQTVRRVHLLVRSNSLSASMSRYLIRRIEETPKIHVKTRTEIVALEGTEHLERVQWRDGSGAVTSHDLKHVFLMTGADANTGWLNGRVALDTKGFIKTGRDLTKEDLAAARWPAARSPYLLETSLPGVFAVGDVRCGSVKRVASAVGEGSIAVSFVHRALAE